jgi:NADPH:quinone reductase
MSDYVMAAAKPGGPEVFRRKDVEVGAPGAGEIRLRQTAVGLNFLDTYHRSGLYPWPVRADLVPGSEGAGVVDAVGEGVTGLSAGDRVAYTQPFNAYASARLIAADRVVKIPEGVSDEEAACAMLKGLTVHYLLTSTYKVTPETVVLGHAAAGGVGLLMGQWLKSIGCTAIGTAGGPEKVALAKAAGWTHVIDTRAGDWVAEVKDLTGGKLCHVVYDSVGKDTWKGSLACLRPRGYFVTFGQSSGMVEGFSIADLAAVGSGFATRPSLFHHIATRAELEARAADMFGLMAAGKLSIPVNQRVPLAEVAEAHRALENRRTTGATVLIP